MMLAKLSGRSRTAQVAKVSSPLSSTGTMVEHDVAYAAATPAARSTMMATNEQHAGLQEGRRRCCRPTARIEIGAPVASGATAWTASGEAPQAIVGLCAPLRKHLHAGRGRPSPSNPRRGRAAAFHA